MKTVTPHTKDFDAILNFVLDNSVPIYIVLGVVFTMWVVSRENKR